MFPNKTVILLIKEFSQDYYFSAKIRNPDIKDKNLFLENVNVGSQY